MEQIQPASERELKLASSLRVKKYRKANGLFLAEGQKVVSELFQSFEPYLVFIQEGSTFTGTPELQRQVSERQMKQISLLNTPSDVLAIFKGKGSDVIAPRELTLALDAIQNPGNLGTIIRLCDWLGIRQILCGKGTVDVFNPKVVQSTAGSLGNVQILEEQDLSKALPQYFDRIIGTDMVGTPYKKATIEEPSKTVLLLGNEGQGLSPELRSLCTEILTIPPAETSTGESLNVALSAAIILSHLT
ncbi:MAG: RNA methyltransferase [Porphyromonas sp.]|nr:RNA methyltransferase [Porphyromonas sp.]